MPGYKREDRVFQKIAEDARKRVLDSPALQEDLQQKAKQARDEKYQARRQAKKEDVWDVKDREREKGKLDREAARQKIVAEYTHNAKIERADIQRRLKQLLREGVKGYDSWETGMAELFLFSRDIAFMLSDQFHLGTQISQFMGRRKDDIGGAVTGAGVGLWRNLQEFGMGKYDLFGKICDGACQLIGGRTPEALKLEADIPSQMKVEGGKVQYDIKGIDNADLHEGYKALLQTTTEWMLDKKGYKQEAGEKWVHRETNKELTNEDFQYMIRGQKGNEDLLEYIETVKNRSEYVHGVEIEMSDLSDNEEDEKRDSSLGSSRTL